jgi:pimeloyl-ACP methyl ester carboxylesterase
LGIFATGHRYESLSAISHPVSVVNGSNDIMIPTVNSLILQQQIPNARFIIYPDSGRAAHFQYPEGLRVSQHTR